MNAAAEYVRLAVQVMSLTNDRATLIEWWKEEKPHRDQWKLSPDQWPGDELKRAFEQRMADLKTQAA